MIGVVAISGASGADPAAVSVGPTGQLEYVCDPRGNRVPDFSVCGYARGDEAIPHVAASVSVGPVEGDDGSQIQAAIDYVGSLPVGSSGFRGAVVLAPGEYHVAGQICIGRSGVVLRGSGALSGGSVIHATGQDRRALICIGSDDDSQRELTTDALPVVDAYVPVGSNRLTLASAAGLEAGDSLLVTRPATEPWIARVGGNAWGVGWKPGSRNIQWDRVVTRIEGGEVYVDAPMTTAIDQQMGVGFVQAFRWPRRLDHVGLEDLTLRSDFAAAQPHDEEHAWFGVVVGASQNCWVRRIRFRHFAGGAVLLGAGAKQTTIEDCIALQPVSEVGGYRRHTFFTLGQLGLFLRCWSESGRHDFSVGDCAAGPNAFVSCCASEALDYSGPIESWSSGVLYDNVRIDGNDLRLQNNWSTPPGAGWSAANCILWQCRAANARCERPPGADNWAIGVWATFAGDGSITSVSDFVSPQSLYQAQLKERVGPQAARRVDPFLGSPKQATNPTYNEAAEFVAQSQTPARRLVDVISARMHEAVQRRDAGASTIEQILTVQATSDAAADKKKAHAASPETALRPENRLASVANGWIVVDDKVKTGQRLSPTWWRGSIRPDEAKSFGRAVTRFAPGRIGTGLTDDLTSVAEQMAADGVALYDHHYGLWYDRRRDDHLMVRRANGNTAPPFYEQPFARSGQGIAWDGLSKYDLTRYNAWYWKRLRGLAELCDERGLLLLHQNYFQHNVLEAGAHWADSPWRPANNVNDTGLPEPPPYIGDKRIFMAPHFYDLSHVGRREIHRRYIRQCLDAFADCQNVIQTTSAEYTGPLEFVQFWIDTIAQWQTEHNRDLLVGLSCTKDVQDAILADADRSRHVDIVDIRYWTYDKNFKLYAPRGGMNLAPRQHMRQLNPQTSSFASIVKAVGEYRQRYPDKAVTYYADENCRSGRDGWAVLMGGGSLADVPLPDELRQALVAMAPAVGADAEASASPGRWRLANGNDQILAYCEIPSESFVLQTSPQETTYSIRWIDSRTGRIVGKEVATCTGELKLVPQSQACWISATATQ